MRQALGGLPVESGTKAGPASEAERTADGKTFGDVFKDFVNQVDEAQKGFDQAIESVERGDTDNLHQLMIAQNQAQITLKMAAEVRNKVVEAYKEVMRTQF
jgi:flagellar hook-basal body complex protein FliE